MTSNALIDPAPPVNAQDKVDTIFKGVEKDFGFIPDGLLLYGISPPLLEAFLANFSYFMTHEELSPELFGMIRYLNSTGVGCSYCIDFNAGFLINLGKTPEQLQAAQENVDNAPLSDPEKVLLKIALASLKNPDGVTQDELQRARDQGFTDKNIFDAVVAAASNRAFTTVLKTFNVIQQGTSFS